jgi:hypothetical protein
MTYWRRSIGAEHISAEARAEMGGRGGEVLLDSLRRAATRQQRGPASRIRALETSWKRFLSVRPDLFIVGAAKSGTTSLYSHLCQHPQIFMAAQKEPRYFAPDLLGGSVADGLRYGEDHGRYLALFDGVRDEKRVGEASVRYLYSRQAPGLVREFQPRAYVVVMLRDPVEVAHSLHLDRLARGLEDIADFAEALAAEPEREAGRRVPPGAHGPLLLYGKWARLGEQLSRWLAKFPREQVHVVVLDDLRREPAGTLASLLRFLEVDARFRPRRFARLNQSHGVRSPTLRRLLDLPRPMVRQKVPQPVRNRLRFGLVRQIRRMNLKPIEKPPLPPSLRRQLENEFAPDVRLLGELVGRDLTSLWWSPERGRAAAPAGHLEDDGG